MMIIDGIEYSDELISEMWEQSTAEDRKNEFWNKVYKEYGRKFEEFLIKKRALSQQNRQQL